MTEQNKASALTTAVDPNMTGGWMNDPNSDTPSTSTKKPDPPKPKPAKPCPVCKGDMSEHDDFETRHACDLYAAEMKREARLESARNFRATTAAMEGVAMFAGAAVVGHLATNAVLGKWP